MASGAVLNASTVISTTIGGGKGLLFDSDNWECVNNAIRLSANCVVANVHENGCGCV